MNVWSGTYSHAIPIEYPVNPSLRYWCKNNIGFQPDDWHVVYDPKSAYFLFKKKEDAVAFSLVWK